MPTPEARHRRSVISSTVLIFLFFALAILAETYWNAVHHGASQADRDQIRDRQARIIEALDRIEAASGRESPR